MVEYQSDAGRKTKNILTMKFKTKILVSAAKLFFLFQGSRLYFFICLVDNEGVP